MFYIAVIPLILYFVFLIYLYRKNKPTVMKSSTAFVLLTWGLFGLITLGPARLVIPMYLFMFNEYCAWIFWGLLYFSAGQLLARYFQDSVIVYHCQREKLLPALYLSLQTLDETTQWQGNVLSMFGYGLQWTVTGKTCLVFRSTEPHEKNPNRQVLFETIKKQINADPT